MSWCKIKVLILGNMYGRQCYTEWCDLIAHMFQMVERKVRSWYRVIKAKSNSIDPILCPSRITLANMLQVFLSLILNSEVLIHFGSHFKQNGANHSSQLSQFLVCLVIININV